MPRIELPKFNEVETGAEPLPADRYTVQIESAEVTATKDKTGKKVEVVGRVLGPTHQKRKIFWNCSLKSTALWNLKSLLTAAGARFDDNGFATEELVGLKVDVTVGMTTWEGKPSNQIGPPYYKPSIV